MCGKYLALKQLSISYNHATFSTNDNILVRASVFVVTFNRYIATPSILFLNIHILWQDFISQFSSQKFSIEFFRRLFVLLQWFTLQLNHRALLESIQGIRKRPTYRFEDTIVWERWHFWRYEINIDYPLIQCIRGFHSSPLPIFKLSLQVPCIYSSHLTILLIG